jgi:TIR domain
MNTSTTIRRPVRVARHIFISHATADDEFVAQLRKKLEGLDLSVWADSLNLRGGDKLAPTIAQAIEEARQVLVVLSPKRRSAGASRSGRPPRELGRRMRRQAG